MKVETPQFEPMPAERAPVIVSLLGPPGVGKTTQQELFKADLLSCDPTLTATEMDEIAAKKNILIRNAGLGFVVRGLQTGDESVEKYRALVGQYIADSNTGGLIPDDVTMTVIADQVAESVDVATKTQKQLILIMDGTPRTHEQYLTLEKAILPSVPNVAYMAVDLHADRPVIEKRIIDGKRGRTDDEAVGKRIENYEKQTKPTTDIMLKKGIARRLDANGTIEQIREDIYNDPYAPHEEGASIFRTDLNILTHEREEQAAD